MVRLGRPILWAARVQQKSAVQTGEVTRPASAAGPGSRVAPERPSRASSALQGLSVAEGADKGWWSPRVDLRSRSADTKLASEHGPPRGHAFGACFDYPAAAPGRQLFGSWSWLSERMRPIEVLETLDEPLEELNVEVTEVVFETSQPQEDGCFADGSDGSSGRLGAT